MLEGMQYYWAIQGLTLLYELLMEALLVQFFKWCEQREHATIPEELWDYLVQAHEAYNINFHGNDNNQRQQTEGNSDRLESLIELVLEPLLGQLKNSKSSTFAIWIMYPDTQCRCYCGTSLQQWKVTGQYICQHRVLCCQSCVLCSKSHKLCTV